MLEPRTHSSYLQAVFLSENNIGNGVLALNVQHEQEATAGITVTKAVTTKYSLSDHRVHTNSSIEVAMSFAGVLFKRLRRLQQKLSARGIFQ